MSKIQIELDRGEAYALLVATEFVRQLFLTTGNNVVNDEEGGTPLISSIRLLPADREYTRMTVLFEFGDSDFVAKVSVATDDVWPKKAHVNLIRIDIRATDIVYSVELVGNPAHPVVKIGQMRIVPRGELGDPSDYVPPLWRRK